MNRKRSFPIRASVNLPVLMMIRVDTLALERKINRSAMLRRLVGTGLQHMGRTKNVVEKQEKN